MRGTYTFDINSLKDFFPFFIPVYLIDFFKVYSILNSADFEYTYVLKIVDPIVPFELAETPVSVSAKTFNSFSNSAINMNLTSFWFDLKMITDIDV
jgi:hypothetical protein